MSLREGAVARALYLAAAQGTAWLYALSGKIRSAGARRSVGTGEIYFGRSDIDLELVLKPGSCDGRSLGSLYQVHRIIRALNPALGHIWVMGPGDIDLLSEWDTVWGSMADDESMELALKLVQGKSNSKPGTMRMLSEEITFTASPAEASA